MSTSPPKLGPNEHLPTNVSAHSKGCIGCQKTGADVMVTMIVPDPSDPNAPDFHDYFLTQEQAIHLRDLLDRVIGQNVQEQVREAETDLSRLPAH